MSNLSNTPRLFTCRIDKGNIHENSLYDLFAMDNDFSENEDFYREDTLSLGFKDEAERVSKEIFDIFKDIEDEFDRVQKMFDKVFDIRFFVGQSTFYGSYVKEIIETEFEYILIIATIM
jgi:hypothetical protein